MKKYLRYIVLVVLLVGTLCTSALAVEPRWETVASISPSMSAADGMYTSYIIGLEGTTKIECTLTLYEKGFWGNYTGPSAPAAPALPARLSFLRPPKKRLPGTDLGRRFLRYGVTTRQSAGGECTTIFQSQAGGGWL